MGRRMLVGTILRSLRAGKMPVDVVTVNRLSIGQDPECLHLRRRVALLHTLLP